MAAKTFPNGSANTYRDSPFLVDAAVNLGWVQYAPPIPHGQAWTVGPWDTYSFGSGGGGTTPTVPTTGQLWPRRK